MMNESKQKGAYTMTDKERSDAQQALLYELRLLVDASEKENYTKQEVKSFLDQIARAKAQT